MLGICMPSAPSMSCKNGVQDPRESDVDCGGICPVKCGKGQRCDTALDCQSGRCQLGRCETGCQSLVLLGGKGCGQGFGGLANGDGIIGISANGKNQLELQCGRASSPFPGPTSVITLFGGTVSGKGCRSPASKLEKLELDQTNSRLLATCTTSTSKQTAHIDFKGATLSGGCPVGSIVGMWVLDTSTLGIKCSNNGSPWGAVDAKIKLSAKCK
jgi:hypothetical protein